MRLYLCKIFILLFMCTFARAAEFTTSLSLLIDGNYSTDILASPNVDESKFLVEFATTVDALDPILPDDIRNRLLITHQNVTSISLMDLKKEGILVSFNERLLELNLNIPPEKRKIDTMKAADTYGPYTYKYTKIRPGPWSGYFNLRGTETFDYYSGSGTSSSTRSSNREPFLANGELVANYKKLALQNDMDFLEHRNSPVTRQNTQLVYDFESRVVRATAGDLNFQTAGFQVSRSLGGLSLVREPSIEPSIFFGGTRDGQIFLKRQSEVEIRVNGSMIKRVILPAGIHNVQDFPLTPGANNVEFKITDDLGKVEYIQLPMLYDLHLIQVGFHQYGYAAGFITSSSSHGNKTYSEDKGMFSGFHRYGATKYWTPGVNLQFDSTGSMFGIENRLMSPFGYWSLDNAKSTQKNLNDTFGKSTANRLRYESFQFTNNKVARLVVNSGMEMRGSNFTAPGEIKSATPERWIYDLGLQDRLEDLTFGTSYRLNKNWNEDYIGKVFGVDLNKHIFGGAWQAGLAYNYSDQKNGNSHQLLITLNWYGQYGYNSVFASHEVSSKTTRVNWNHNTDNHPNSIRASGVVESKPIGPTAELDLTQRRQKAEISFQQRSGWDTDQKLGTHQSTFRFGTALAWTDMGIGFTRPVSDSFAMIVQSPEDKNNLKGVDIAVNNAGDVAQAYIKNGAPAILPELQSYSDIPVAIDVTNLPLGYSLNPEFAVLRPTYHSGVAMVLKTTKSVTVTGIIKDTNGVPIKFQTGIVKFAAVSNRPNITFFTDDLGQIFIEGIQEASFELVLDSGKYMPVQVQIPAGAIGIVHIPEIVVKEIP